MTDGREQAGNRRGVLAAAGVLGVLMLLVLLGGHGASSGAGGGPDAYSRFVTAHFIDPQLLAVNPDPGPGEPVVDLVPEVYADPEGVLYQFASQSYLLQDIRRNDPRLWQIENGLVTGMAAGHSTPPPFPRPAGDWRGTLRYRDVPTVEVDRDIELIGGPMSPRLILTRDTGPTGTGGPGVQTVGADRWRAGPALTARGFDVGCGGPDAAPIQIRRLGNEVTIAVPFGSPCEVRVGATTFERGQSGFEVLARGERLAFAAPGEPVRTLQRQLLAPDPGRISAPGAGMGRYRAPELASWSQAFEEDLARGVGAGSLPEDDIITSLDRELQLGAQAILDGHFAGLGDTTSIGTITIMDAQTGEVLAMASTPRAGSGDETGMVDQDDPLEAARRRNQNLARLPVGSAVKPLMAAAILQRDPSLSTLQIQGQGEAATLLGLELEPPLGNHAAPAWVDFNAFIQGSDNLYMAALTLLGSADVNGQTCTLLTEQAYRLGAAAGSETVTALTTRQKSVFEIVGPDGRCRAAPLEHGRQLRWADELGTLFDVNPGFAVPGQDCDADEGNPARPSPWRLLLDRYHRVDTCALTASAPEPEALGLAGRLEFRTGVVPIVLGNGDGRWSTIHLAEAYSRVVTGQRVSATFLPPMSTTSSVSGLDPSVRLTLTHALTLVPSGTARGTALPGSLDRLQQRLGERGLVLGAFAKTGTPVVVSSRYTPQDVAINALIRFGRVRLAPGSDRLLVRTVDGERQLAATADAQQQREIAELLANDPAAREALARAPHVTPGQVVQRLVRHLTVMAEGGRPFVIRTENGGRLLVRVASRDEIIGGTGGEDDPSGKVVALVIAAYRPDNADRLRLDAQGRAWDARARPERAYTVVVNLQRESTGGNDAADLAAAVVDGLLRERLAGAGGRR